MSEHTPKDWTVSHPVNAGEKHVRDENGVLVCKCYWPNEDANATLIAAAPNLLEACKRYLDAMERYGHPDKTDRLMRAAIEKAMGEV